MKHITVLACIAIIISMAACKKGLTGFRESLVGNYNCIKHSYSYYPSYDSIGQMTWITSDVVIGTATISVSALASNDSAIVVNGNTYNFSSANGTQIQFWGPSVNSSSQANFVIHNDSIWVQYIYDYGISHEYYYYWTGHKQ